MWPNSRESEPTVISQRAPISQKRTLKVQEESPSATGEEVSASFLAVQGNGELSRGWCWLAELNLLKGRERGAGKTLWLSLLVFVAEGSCPVMYVRAVSHLNNVSICLFLVTFCTGPQQRGEIKDYHAPKYNFCYRLSMVKNPSYRKMWLVCVFFLVVLLISLWYLFMQACSLYRISLQAFMLQTAMNKHHHGHWWHFGKKTKRFWKILSPHGTEAK